MIWAMGAAAVLGGAMPWRRRIWEWMQSLPERLGEARLPIQVGGIAAASIMSLSLSYVVLGGHAGTGDRTGGTLAGTPGTPTITAVVSDTSTWVVNFTTAFSPNGSDTQDSIAITVLRSGAADTLFHAKSGVQSADTVSDNADLKADTTYRVLGRQKGTDGGWSVADTISVVNSVNWLSNLPSGLTVQHNINFSNASDLSYAGERATSTADFDGSALAPPVSPSDVARMILPSGLMGAQGGFSIGSKALTVPASTVRVYMAAAAYFSTGYTWHSGNHKFFYFWRHIDSGSSGSLVLGIDPTRGDDGATDGKAYVNVDPQVYVGGQNVFTVNQAVADSTVSRTAWHQIEIEVVMNTVSTVSDGILKVWVDDVLLISRTDVRWSDNASLMEWRRTNFDPYYGGQNASHNVPSETYLYVDHVYVATSTNRS